MASPESHSGQICMQPRGAPEFSQNGQIDWFGFLKGTAEATISILTRLSSAGVEPLTLLVAQQISSILSLPSTGQENVRQALSLLKAFGSTGDILWFGFGVRHLTRSLAQTKEGLSCVALCAALTEAHSADLAALVLSEFADLSGAPREVSPSLLQWKRLVSACSGSFARSSFNDTVRKFTTHRGGLDIRTVGHSIDPRDLARALHALGLVSTGHLESVTFSGGPECGWVGAVAEWLLGLSVSVQREDQDIPSLYGLYASPKERAQVQIIYGQDVEEYTTSLEIQKSYRLRRASEMIRERLEPSGLNFCIRIPWNNILRSTFGSASVEQLTVQLQRSFITALGSAACLFEHVAKASTDVKKEWLKRNIDYKEGTYGRGLISMVARCFPEITSDTTLAGMEFLGRNFNEASMAYESAIFKISLACACGCEKEDLQMFPRSIPGVCLTALFDLIVLVARAKANIHDDGLLPTQSGLFSLYNNFTMKMNNSPVDRLLGIQPRTPFDTAICLYCGCYPQAMLQGRKGSISAISHRGLCVYLESLCNIYIDPEEFSQVRIVPGSIELDGRIHFEVRDSHFEEPNYQTNRTQIVTTKPKEDGYKFNDITIDPVAMEVQNHVAFSYKLTTRLGSSWITPALLSLSVGRAMGHVQCHPKTCSAIGHIPPILLIEGEGVVGTSSSDVSTFVRIVPRNSPIWCIALLSTIFENKYYPVSTLDGALIGHSDHMESTFLRRSECIDCCLREAFRHDECRIVFLV